MCGRAAIRQVSLLDYISLHKVGERFSSLFALNTRLQEEILESSKKKLKVRPQPGPCSRRALRTPLPAALARGEPTRGQPTCPL